MGISGGECCEFAWASGSAGRSECFGSRIGWAVFKFSSFVDGVYPCGHPAFLITFSSHYGTDHKKRYAKILTFATRDVYVFWGVRFNDFRIFCCFWARSCCLPFLRRIPIFWVYAPMGSSSFDF
jgi:hypothetical protein